MSFWCQPHNLLLLSKATFAALFIFPMKLTLSMVTFSLPKMRVWLTSLLLVFLYLLPLFLQNSAVKAQQSEQPMISFELDAISLLRWETFLSEPNVVDIEVTNALRSHDSPRHIRFSFTSSQDDMSYEKGRISLERRKWFPVKEIIGKRMDLSLEHEELYIKFAEVSWTNDSGSFGLAENGSMLVLKNLPLEPSKYQIIVTLNPGKSGQTLLNTEQAFAEGETPIIRITQPSVLDTIWGVFVNKEGLLVTIIVALITLLIGALKEKIKTAFNWMLDALGQYVGGVLAERRFVRRYLEQLVFDHKYLSLIGFNTAGVSRPRLEEVFVSLRITSSGTSPTSRSVEDQDTSGIPFSAALRQFRQMVILGGPGAGKTTTLSYALLVFAQKTAKGKLGIEEDLLPIYIPLRRLSTKARSIVEDITDSDTQILSAEVVKECPAHYFERQLKKGRCLVLLDGLDEVIDEKTHRSVAQRINSLVAAYPNNRYLVTCRTAGWKNLLSGEFQVLQTQNFNRDEIQRFVLGWHQAVITQSEYGKLQLAIPDTKKFHEAWIKRQEDYVKVAVDVQSRRLIRAIDSNNRILAIAVNPMLLSLISLVHFNRQYLPRGRTILYNQCIELLIDAWDRTREVLSFETKITPQQKEAVLREIAADFQLKGRGEDSRANLQSIIVGIATKLGISIPADELLEDIEARSGLLIERSIDILGFSHLTLQEYLVAKHIYVNPGNYPLLRANFDKQEWREVTLLYTGLIDDATPLISDVAGEETLDRYILAGYCIGDSQQCDSSVSAKIVDRLAGELSQNSGRADEIINVLSAIAAEYNDRPARVEESLSHNLIKKLSDTGTSKSDRLNAISILGRARITRALPALVCLLNDPDDSIRSEIVKAVASYGNLALPEIEQHPLLQVSKLKKISVLELQALQRSWNFPSSLDLTADVTTQITKERLSELASPIIEVLSGINTGPAAKLLLRLYDLNSDSVDMHVSYRLSQLLTNTFIESDLRDMELTDVPEALTRLHPISDSWGYATAGIGFGYIQAKLRKDLCDGLDAALNDSVDAIQERDEHLSQLRKSSIKILFPSLLWYVKHLPPHALRAENTDDIEKLYAIQRLGFDQLEPNKLFYLLNQISKNRDMPLDLMLQNISRADNSSNSYAEKKSTEIIVFLCNVYFLFFYIVNLFFAGASIKELVSYSSTPTRFRVPLEVLIMLTIPIAFYVALIVITKWKLKRRFLSSQTIGLIIFPIPNSLKILPYLTKQKLWVTITLFQLLSLIFSITAGIVAISIYMMLFKGLDYLVWQPLAIGLGFGGGFILFSTLYWRRYVLSRNPVYQLLLAHHQGRQLALDMPD